MQEEIRDISKKFNFNPVEIPAELKTLPVLEALTVRLEFLIEKFGGYVVLAKSLPHHNAKWWEKKIRDGKCIKLGDRELIRLFDLFKDPVLPAIIAHASGGFFIDLRQIPTSNSSQADLFWLMQRYYAYGILIECDKREVELEGEPIDFVINRRLAWLDEMTVIMRQFTLSLNPELDKLAEKDATNN